ncbi:putative succinyl-diaminopimelate desuccinylase [Anaerohalosphaera lusitana]|uniref:Probable succinyl-diaminopimelate desuccinylase n=2 Tax=Anaerohalosphaera lusitana TaxID=1936003 RepID=A0A1U9NIE3_9BACT|nr:putative succinyl-diaminopimelate desuccinylase [Anaerohalosphaera lusitana]
MARSTADIGELRAAKVLRDYLEPLGIDCDVDCWDTCRANFTAHLGSNGDRPGLLFAGHLDVVPPGDAVWSHPPFEPAEVEGKMYGRGTADMKSGLAAVAAAIAEIKNEDTELAGDVIFTATADEETGSYGIKRFIEKRTPHLSRLQGIVVPEPTGLEIVTGHRGILWLEFRTHGKTAHGSMPELGVNAITRMLPLLNKLNGYELPADEDPMLGRSTLSINEIHGGKATNVVPDACSLKIDIRTLPQQSQEGLIEHFQQMVRKIGVEHADFDADIEVIKSVEALLTDSNCEFVKSLRRATEGKKPGIVSYTTDGPWLAELGVPVVIFGPGEPSACHKPDEYVELDQLERAKDHYKDLILECLA